jgi:hypothetical protein
LPLAFSVDADKLCLPPLPNFEENAEVFVKLALISVLLLCPAASTSQAAAGKPSSDSIALSGILESQLTLTSEELKFTVSITNNSSEPLQNVKIVRLSDNYLIYSICTPTCAKTSMPAVVADNIPQGRKFSSWGILKPLHSHGKQKVVLMVEWYQGGERNTGVVSLGENEVQQTWYYRYSTYFYGPIKTFAIPATLALIGYLLSRRAKKREEAKAEVDKEQGIRAEIWKQMLPTSHKFTSKYYLPISQASSSASEALADYALEMYGDVTRPPLGWKAARRAFFFSLLLDRRMKFTVQTIGGFIFKDLRGEDLAINCWDKYRDLFVGVPGYDFHVKFRTSAALLDFQESYETFLQKFCAPAQVCPATNDMVPEMEVSWREFQVWLQRKENVLWSMLYLRGFTSIFDFEINRPYEYWYKPGPTSRPDSPDVAEKRARRILIANGVTVTTVRELLQNVGREYRLPRIEEYLNEAFPEPAENQPRSGMRVILRSGIRVILIRIPFLNKYALKRS